MSGFHSLNPHSGSALETRAVHQEGLFTKPQTWPSSSAPMGAHSNPTTLTLSLAFKPTTASGPLHLLARLEPLCPRPELVPRVSRTASLTVV